MRLILNDVFIFIVAHCYVVDCMTIDKKTRWFFIFIFVNTCTLLLANLKYSNNNNRK